MAWRTRSIFPSLSPPYLPTPGRLFGHGGDIDREVHRGPPPGESGEGGSSLHRPISAMHRTQMAPFDEIHAHQKTAMTLVVATIRLRRSSPRSRSVWCTVCSQGYPQPAALSRGQRAANGDNIKNPLLFATTPPKPKLKAWPSTTSPVIPPLRRRTFGFAERTPPDLCGKSCTSRSLNYFGKYKSLNHESP